MALSGAIGTPCPVSIGKSFSKERFMCLEEHDVVAVDFFLSADPLFATDQSAEDGTDADDLSFRADWDNSTQEETRESSPESEGESGDKDTLQSTAAAHEEMREFWTRHYGTDCDQTVLEQVGRLLFLKRKRGGGDRCFSAWSCFRVAGGDVASYQEGAGPSPEVSQEQRHQ